MKRAIPIFLLVTGCAGQAGRAPDFSSLQAGAKSVCELMADPTPYVGQRIVLEGVYFATPHERLLVDRDRDCPNLPVRHSIQVDGNREAEAIVDRFRKKHPTVRIPVVYSGILTARSIVQGCAEPSCRAYALEESQLLAAFPRTAFAVGG